MLHGYDRLARCMCVGHSNNISDMRLSTCSTYLPFCGNERAKS